MKSLLMLLILIGGATVGYVWYAQAGGEVRPSYRLAEVKRGDLRATISATGTIEPEELVDVGAQVAGRIERLGRDPASADKTIDYGTSVEEGTILAQIDDSIYRAQVEQARASVVRAEAELPQLEAKLWQTEQEWKRAQVLQASKTISEAESDLAQANHEVARGALEVGKATVALTRSALNLSEINLGYTTIKSPVNGVIIDRRVNVGQTVVSSLNAPSLFLIAKDLKRLQVWASVNEADIGRIHTGQAVRFTVDAHPDQTFLGEVGQIRLNATMTQNVVTYTVVVMTDNSDGKLLPYLTANLHFELDHREAVLTVPALALRWRPRPENIDPASRSSEAVSSGKGGKEATRNRPEESGRGTLWIPQGEFVKPLPVTVGLSDGLTTEISGEGVVEGLSFVVGEVRAAKGSGSTNPFAPKTSAVVRPRRPAELLVQASGST